MKPSFTLLLPLPTTKSRLLSIFIRLQHNLEDLVQRLNGNPTITNELQILLQKTEKIIKENLQNNFTKHESQKQFEKSIKNALSIFSCQCGNCEKMINALPNVMENENIKNNLLPLFADLAKLALPITKKYSTFSLDSSLRSEMLFILGMTNSLLRISFPSEVQQLLSQKQRPEFFKQCGLLFNPKPQHSESFSPELFAQEIESILSVLNNKLPSNMNSSKTNLSLFLKTVYSVYKNPNKLKIMASESDHDPEVIKDDLPMLKEVLSFYKNTTNMALIKSGQLTKLDDEIQKLNFKYGNKQIHRTSNYTFTTNSNSSSSSSTSSPYNSNAVKPSETIPTICISSY